MQNIWYSSLGSHMGHEAETARRLFHLFRHKKRPSHDIFKYYTMKGGPKSIGNC